MEYTFSAEEECQVQEWVEFIPVRYLPLSPELKMGVLDDIANGDDVIDGISERYFYANTCVESYD